MAFKPAARCRAGLVPAPRLPAPAVARVNCYLSKAAVAVAPGKVLITAQHPLN